MSVSFSCKDCKEKICLKSGKPCKKIEKELIKVTVSRRDHKFTIVDPQYMDKVNYKDTENGRRKKIVIYGDNYEPKYNQ